MKNPKNWSGLWINREDALVYLDDCMEETINPQNDYERGLNDAYYNCADFISGMEGHDNIGTPFIVNTNAVVKTETYGAIPLACRNCSNHPNNGGSGICHCTLGNNVTW